jgi:hypothetical protein
VTVLAIFLTTAGAGSALAAHRRASGGEVQAQAECSISLLPSAPAVRVGEAASLTGSLSCTGTTPVAQQSVTIEQHVAGTPGLALAGTATTGPGGEFSFTTSSGLERVSSFRAEALGVRSLPARVTVSAAGVTLTGPAAAGSQLPLATRRGRSDGTAGELTFQGTVAPAAPGARVVLQRQSRRNPQVWRPIAHGMVQADGSYTLLHAFSVGGTATVRVVVRGRGLRATCSEAITYVIAHTSSRSQSSPPPAISL